MNQVNNFSETYLTEAFSQLRLLEDDINLSDVGEEADDLATLVPDDVVEETPEEFIIDPEAKNDDQLQDHYVGKVILECRCCHARMYVDADDVDIEGKVANVKDECPNCGNKLGFTIVGKVEKFDDESEEETEVELEDEVEEEKNESLTEGAMSLKDRLARKHLFDAEESFDEEPIEESAINEDNWDKLTDAYPELEDGEIHEELEESDDLWDEHDFDNLEPDEIEALKASVDKYGVVRNKAVYNDIRKLQRERQNEALCEDDICPECGKNPCECEKHDLHEEECCPECDDKSCECEEDDDIEEGCKVNESVEVHADGEDKVDVAKNEDGSMTINVGEAEVEGEAIVPLSDEDQAALEANSEEPVEEIAEEPVEEVPEEEEAPIEDEFEEEPTEEVQEESLAIEDFDDHKFNNLVEQFLCKVYNNVKSFTTDNVQELTESFELSGNIEFKSGATQESKFVFENAYISKRGKLIMEGYNTTFSGAKKAFTIKGVLTEGKYTLESMTYNYTATQLNESNENETVRVYGRVK